MSSEEPTVALIAGSGFSSLLHDATAVTVETPYGAPSADVLIGDIAGTRVAFLPRHGALNEHPPHQINNRANLWALGRVGARQVVAAMTASSLLDAIRPGTMVVPDQLVDRTHGRVQTFMDAGIIHAPFADPYCSRLRAALITDEVTDGGTLVVIDGPRFSTRAEARSYAAQGWSMINMTGHPEAVLARELGLCFASIILVANRDAGAVCDSLSDEPLPPPHIESIAQLKRLVEQAIRGLSPVEGCPCSEWQEGAGLPSLLP